MVAASRKGDLGLEWGVWKCADQSSILDALYIVDYEH